MSGEHAYFVYLLASRFYGTFYVGVTNDLIRRVWEHKNDQGCAFTRKHGIKTLVWFEQHTDINAAILREKRIKRWARDWKIALVEQDNRHWEDLYPVLIRAGWRVRD